MYEYICLLPASFIATASKDRSKYVLSLFDFSAKYIEVCDEIPINPFGYAIPCLKPVYV